MTSEEIKAAVQQLLAHHPGLRRSDEGHTKKLVRYVAANDEPIAFDIQDGRGCNLWVRQDAVNLRQLQGITREPYDKSKTSKDGRHSNLDTEERFRGHDVFAFTVRDPWEAVRVIIDVAGDGRTP